MSTGSSALDRSMADRAESNKVPTRNEPNSDQEPQRSRGLDDHPTPPHRDEMNRKTAPGGDSAAPSSPAPVANRITATESPTKKACNGLLQHNLPRGDICPQQKSTRYSITPSAISKQRGVAQSSALGQRRPARTRHRAICDDRYRANLVRTAPLLRADMILGKDECG